MAIGIVLCLLFGSAAMIIARHRGRSGCTWFAVGTLLGPFALIVALLPSAEQVDIKKAGLKE
jgi:hypothetical protein